MNYREGCALVERAYDYGFRYFDVAPPYGDGFAERILGDVLPSVRATVNITTKAGRPRPEGPSRFRAMRRRLLPIKRRLPWLWGGLAKMRAQHPVPRQHNVAPGEVVASIEESLRRLRTDHIDYLLLHEVLPEEVTDELLEALARLRADGRLREIGLATSIASTAQLLSEYPGSFDVVQVRHYWGAFQPTLAGERLLLTHGCIGSGIPLIESPEFRRVAAGESRAEMNRVLDDPLQAPDLLIAAGLQANPDGVLLVASSRPERLRRLAEVVSSSEMTAMAAQLNDCFVELSATMTAPGHG